MLTKQAYKTYMNNVLRFLTVLPRLNTHSDCRSQSQLTASSGLMDYSSSEHRKWSRLASGSSTAPSEVLPLRRLARGATVV